MYTQSPITDPRLAEFRIDDRVMRYSQFVPRLYNLCRSHGFRPGFTLPSRAFCSDESQGYPVILLAKHFGVFPFNHGRTGGIMAIDRHGPYSHHGEDLVIIQASHVGYEPEQKKYGIYRRGRTENGGYCPNCGLIASVLSWYQQQFEHACNNIRLIRQGQEWLIAIDNQLLDNQRSTGLILHLDQLIDNNGGRGFRPLRSLSTARVFRPAESLLAQIGAEETEQPIPICSRLTPDMFYFRRPIEHTSEGKAQVERNLQPIMPTIVTSRHPSLAAAQANTQFEFERAYRSIVGCPEYRGKNLLFIAGINIDISPSPEHPFPLTDFAPWAAYLQLRDGSRRLLEQEELWQALSSQATDNPDQTDLENAIREMNQAEEVPLELN
ncbi:MAG TPA: hypothetical protein VIQ75_05220 [Gammaproteobacteria bacterium]